MGSDPRDYGNEFNYPRPRSRAERKQALRDGSAGIRTRQQPLLLSFAAADWQEAKKTKWSPKMSEIAANSISHLSPVLGKKLLVDIEARNISKYQQARLDEVHRAAR